MVIIGDRAVPMTSTFGSTCFRPSAIGSQCGGSRVAGYAKTVEEVDGGNRGLTGPQQLESILAMPVYKDKSTEELRWEDYKSGDRGGVGFGAWAMRPNLFTASCWSANSASNPFSSSTPGNIFASASASEGFGESNTSAFSSFSPFGHSSSVPSSSDFGASTAPALSSTPFQASAWPFATTSSSTPLASGKPSASGLFGPNGSEPPSCISSLPTLGPTPSVFSSSGSFNANCFGTSSQSILGANNNTSEFFGGEPTSSISSHFGSVPPTFVSPSLFAQATDQVPVSQFVAPSFRMNFLSRESTFSSAPGGHCCICPSNISNTAFTGDGSTSAGNLFSRTQVEVPPNLSGFGQATTFLPSPFKPMQTVPCTGVPIGVFGQSVHGTGVPIGNFGPSVPGFNCFMGVAFLPYWLPCWIAFGQPIASPPGWVASAQPIAEPVTCNNPFHREAGALTPTNGSINFGPQAFAFKRGGSRVEAYKATGSPLDGMLKSISAMPIYLGKSPEEIQWEDYQSLDKGGPTPRMGSVQTAPSSFSFSTPSNLFGSSRETAKLFGLSGQTAPSSFSFSTPANLIASEKPTFTCQKFRVPTTPIFGSSSFASPSLSKKKKSFAAPSGECQFGQSFATPFSSTSANLFACQTPLFNSADLASSTPFGPHPSGQPSANPFSSSTSINSFVASQLPTFGPAAFGASATTPLASSVFAAPSSPSPFGLATNPFSSSTPSNTFPPTTSSFGSSGFGESTACPFTATPSSTFSGFGTTSGFGSGANGSAPSFIASSSPTFESSPSASSSSFSFGIGTSSQPISKAPSTHVSGSYDYAPGGTVNSLNSSVFCPFGSVPPKSVSPSSSGPITAQSIFSQSAEPSFQKTHPVFGQSNIPFAPSVIPSFGALKISSTASTGNDSEGNLCSSTQFICPTSAACFDPTTVPTADNNGVPLGNSGLSVAEDGFG